MRIPRHEGCAARFSRAAPLLSAALLWVFAGIAAGQDRTYPVKPARFVISTTAGSGGEAFARAVAEQLGQRLNQSIIVDPRPGAGGNLAAELVAKAPADGYTLLLGSIASLAIAVSYYRNLNYDVRRDFAPISKVGQTAIGLFVSPGVPADNLAALTRMIKAAPPGTFSCASAGVGGLLHLTCEMYQKAAGVKLLHVPYKGTAFFLPDLLTGQVTLAFDTLPIYLGHLKAGKVKVLAVTTPKRTAVLPEVPTAEEAGLPGVVAVALYGLLAPVRAPGAVVQTLSRELVPTLRDAALREKLLLQAIEAEPSSPEGLRELLESEIAKWARVMKDSDIRPE
jgi:tripartite-type tricarboxylate transporter receptor subunit TctC